MLLQGRACNDSIGLRCDSLVLKGVVVASLVALVQAFAHTAAALCDFIEAAWCAIRHLIRTTEADLPELTF